MEQPRTPRTNTSAAAASTASGSAAERSTGTHALVGAVRGVRVWPGRGRTASRPGRAQRTRAHPPGPATGRNRRTGPARAPAGPSTPPSRSGQHPARRSKPTTGTRGAQYVGRPPPAPARPASAATSGEWNACEVHSRRTRTCGRARPAARRHRRPPTQTAPPTPGPFTAEITTSVSPDPLQPGRHLRLRGGHRGHRPRRPAQLLHPPPPRRPSAPHPPAQHPGHVRRRDYPPPNDPPPRSRDDPPRPQQPV